MLKLRRICGDVFSSIAMDVAILEEAKASVSLRNRIPMTAIAQMLMKAPRVVACDIRVDV